MLTRGKKQPLREMKTLTVSQVVEPGCCHGFSLFASKYSKSVNASADEYDGRTGGCSPVTSNKNLSGYHRKSIDHPHLAQFLSSVQIKDFTARSIENESQKTHGNSGTQGVGGNV